MNAIRRHSHWFGHFAMSSVGGGYQANGIIGYVGSWSYSCCSKSPLGWSLLWGKSRDFIVQLHSRPGLLIFGSPFLILHLQQYVVMHCLVMLFSLRGESRDTDPVSWTHNESDRDIEGGGTVRKDKKPFMKFITIKAVSSPQFFSQLCFHNFETQQTGYLDICIPRSLHWYTCSLTCHQAYRVLVSNPTSRNMHVVTESHFLQDCAQCWFWDQQP